MSETLIVRPLHADDDLAVLTEVIHTAYARRAAEDLRFWATHQSVADTAERFRQGQGFVALMQERLVGTITARPPDSNSQVDLYRDPFTWTLCQFAVLPKYQAAGVGRRLHDAAVEHARRQGARCVAFDTAAPAQKLIKMYQRWGYTIVGEVDWRPFTNYPSVILAKKLVSA